MLINFPIKGVNRLLPRGAQPANTAWDMLNVVPQDTLGRMRGAKRSGASKLWAAAIGGSADAVLLLDQTTLTTSGAVGGVSVFSDTFTYSNGELHSVSTNKWSQFDDALGTTSTDVVVASNVASLSGVHQNIIFPTSAPTYSQTGGYTLKMKFALGDGCDCGIDVEGDEVVRYTTGPQLSIAIHNAAGAFDLTIQPRGSTFTEGVDYNGNLPITGPVTDTLFEVKVVVSAGTGTSRTAKVYIDNVQWGITMPMPAPGVTGNFVVTMAAVTAKTVKVDDVDLSTNGSGIVTGNPTRVTNLIAVANKDIYMGDIATQAVLCTNGSNKIAQSVVPQGCYSQGKYFLVDGTSIVQVDLATTTVESYTATAGSAPTGATICCIWRDRLVLGDGFNFYFSRVGVHTDWAFGLPDDPASAFAGNDSIAGHIGEPLVSLMPLADDTMGLGGDHTFHIIRGDPAAGGTIDLISDQVGILGPRAWCKDPEGTLYMAGTGGFYKFTARYGLELLSGKSYSQFFAGIDRSTSQVILVWDRDKQGCYIFVTKYGVTPTSTHLWYDRRTDSQDAPGGLFPLRFTSDMGPTAALVYDGDAPTDRVLLLGGRTGFVRKADGSLTDDGTAITSYVTIGPVPLGTPTNDGILSRVIVTLGDGVAAGSYGLTVKLMAGLTAYDVTEGTAKRLWTRRYDGRIGRLEPILSKLRGVFASITLFDDSTDKTFSFESVNVDVEPAGPTRRG